ncbi:CRTAC1 family protein [Aquimonas voraii]|uniref:Repeat domain-containing protein n=1 Tax=Aquimonas voraii TaxID=265719 RepID=A0A1G6XFC3_9GAMM|nr:CRTAC1 family protein [Aquimonas voraii]SDD76025.1 Repeat domain-containing protein [Aquimonas voraii]
MGRIKNTLGLDRLRPARLALAGRLALGAACAAAAGPASAQSSSWHFEEDSVAAGLRISHGYTFGFDGEPDMMGGGAAAGDLDGDGDVDLVVVRGDLGAPALLRNRGDGRFESLTAGSGVPAAGKYNGVHLVDLDADGRLDLLFGGLGGQSPRLFRNLGGWRFAAIADTGLELGDDSWSMALADYDGDGLLDLALGRWARGVGRSGHLFRGLGDGRFQNADADLAISAALGQRSYTFTPQFGDLDGDGRIDLALAADFGTSRVLLNRGGRLVDTTTASIDDENGMGAALGDYDGDGDLDWFVTSIHDPSGVPLGNWGTSGNRLYRNRGNGEFEDVSLAAGVREGGWGWAACFADIDLDGHLDIVHVNGMSAAPAAAFHADPSRLFISDGRGGFTEQALARGFDDRGQGRALVCFDADNDGDVDLFVQNNSGSSRFYRNQGASAGGRWLRVTVRQDGPNPEAIGARVELRAGGRLQVREIGSGSQFLSSGPAEAHFGVGSAAVVERLQVRWPDGTVERFPAPQLDQPLRLLRGRGLPPLSSARPVPLATPTTLLSLALGLLLLAGPARRRFDRATRS